MTIIEMLRLLRHKLYISGVRLRCPNCEQGRMFRHLFKIDATCDVCGVRFERRDGESIGGMAITMGIIPPLSILGFFVVEFLTPAPVWLNAAFWLLFIVVGCVWIYRHSRAAWVAVSYVTGGVYADEPQPDTSAERENLVAASRRATAQRNQKETR